jgi:hypothetical protein
LDGTNGGGGSFGRKPTELGGAFGAALEERKGLFFLLDKRISSEGRRER